MDAPARPGLPAGPIRLRTAGAWRRALLASLPAAWLPACGPADLANALTSSGGGRRVADLAYGPLPRQRLDLYLPAGAGEATPLLAFFHGGNWQQGSRRDYPFLARALASRGLAVAVPDYRLHPEGHWPDFLEDGALAVAWLRGERGRAAGAPPGPCFAMGHSAGAYNAAALALDPRWLDAAGLPGGRDALAGLIALAGPFDWTPRDEPLATIFAAAPGGRLEAAPSDAALAGAPPALLLHGEGDTRVGTFHSTRLAERLRAAGGAPELRLYPRVGHVGIVAAFAAPLRALGLAGAPVMEDVVAFVERAGAAHTEGATPT
ncbi:alpha/beta hydrolase [Craurococcus roseus]|uniref:Alpha/beta hydrolase n=1 Tax=Craurococcus roseus TaxID=77585 RepID=A0ABN1F5X0_9PROT